MQVGISGSILKVSGMRSLASRIFVLERKNWCSKQIRDLLLQIECMALVTTR